MSANHPQSLSDLLVFRRTAIVTARKWLSRRCPKDTFKNPRSARGRQFTFSACRQCSNIVTTFLLRQPRQKFAALKSRTLYRNSFATFGQVFAKRESPTLACNVGLPGALALALLMIYFAEVVHLGDALAHRTRPHSTLKKVATSAMPDQLHSHATSLRVCAHADVGSRSTMMGVGRLYRMIWRCRPPSAVHQRGRHSHHHGFPSDDRPQFFPLDLCVAGFCELPLLLYHVAGSFPWRLKRLHGKVAGSPP